MSAVLTCSGVDAGYVPGRPVLRDVNITLEAGQVLALLGPNGACKTTLMLTIAGLQAPLAGSIGLGGVPMRPGSARAAVKAGLVLVPDDRSLFKELTVAENLRLAARRGSTTTETIFEYFPELKRRVKVTAGNLSGGEQQILAVARGLLAAPRLLLLDEPSLGLAPKLVDQVFEIVDGIRSETTSVLLVEQNALQALARADRAYVMESGTTTLAGTGKELLGNPQVRLAYLGL
jgi:branched-chain amino acid transport system ATP-binding protein